MDCRQPMGSPGDGLAFPLLTRTNDVNSSITALTHLAVAALAVD